VKKEKSLEQKNEELLLLIGQKIKTLRKEYNWSQEDLAYNADIDRSYIGYIENGKYNVTIKKLLQISEALQIDIIDLLQDS
jgi:transcriptional regulator with XRE-family HTH domain